MKNWGVEATATFFTILAPWPRMVVDQQTTVQIFSPKLCLIERRPVVLVRYDLYQPDEERFDVC